MGLQELQPTKDTLGGRAGPAAGVLPASGNAASREGRSSGPCATARGQVLVAERPRSEGAVPPSSSAASSSSVSVADAGDAAPGATPCCGGGSCGAASCAA